WLSCSCRLIFTMDFIPFFFPTIDVNLLLNALPSRRSSDLAIASLPGRKFIFTNGSRAHAEKVAERLGFTDHFEDIFEMVGEAERSEEHTSELQSRENIVCRLLLEKKKTDPS